MFEACLRHEFHFAAALRVRRRQELSTWTAEALWKETRAFARRARGR